MQQRLPRSISFGCREKDDKNRSYFSKFYIDVFIKAAHAGSYVTLALLRLVYREEDGDSRAYQTITTRRMMFM